MRKKKSVVYNGQFRLFEYLSSFGPDEFLSEAFANTAERRQDLEKNFRLHSTIPFIPFLTRLFRKKGKIRLCLFIYFCDEGVQFLSAMSKFDVHNVSQDKLFPLLQWSHWFWMEDMYFWIRLKPSFSTQRKAKKRNDVFSSNKQRFK